MKLLNRSTCAIVLGVKIVTQDNTGKKSPGVDGETAPTPARRVRLVKRLLDLAQKGWDDYRAKPLKRRLIPKPNGKKRPLSIPTIEDRAVQATIKLALEPFYEAKFEPNSYGFRPAMSAHDAIEAVFKQISRKQKWALDADIKGCFDNISHSAVMRSIPYEYRGLVSEWLKAGYVEEHKVFPTYEGTPQGGVISPLLANIVLDGMERDLKESAKTWQFVEDKSLPEPIDLAKKWHWKIGNGTLGREKSKTVALIGYAGDFVILHEDRRVIEYAKDWIENWLSLRGLTLS